MKFNIRKTKDWYALDYIGNVKNNAYDKESVKHEHAHYYIYQSGSNTFYIYDRNFKESYLKHSNIFSDHKINGFTYHNDPTNIKLEFFLTFLNGDPNKSRVTKQSFSGGIHAFKKCLDHMEEIGKFWTKREMELYHIVDDQRAEIAKLENEIKELRIKLGVLV